MKKLSSFLVLMLIALMLFVSCNGSTPTKEEPAKLEERAATPEDAEIVSALVSSALNAVRENLDGVTRIEDDNTVKFDNVKVINPTTQEVICVLNGTAKYEGTQQLGTLILDLTTGTKYKDKGHTLYAKSSTDGKNIEIVLDGYKLTIPENFLPNINGSTPTVTERAATDSDYDLFFNLNYASNTFFQVINDLPTTSYKIVDENNVEFYGCSFNSYSTNGSTLPVTLYGNMYTDGSHYKINLTEGTKIGGIDYTVDAEFTIGSSSGYNFTKVMVNGITVKGLSDLLRNSIIRTAKSEDVVLIQKVLEACDYVIANSYSLTLANPETLRVEGTNYKFTNLAFETSNTNYILYGTLYTNRVDQNKSYYCRLEPNTKIAGENHILQFNITVSTDVISGSKTYDAINVMIDSHAIMGLEEALNASSTN